MTENHGTEASNQTDGNDDIANPIAPAPVLYAAGIGLGALLEWLLGLDIVPSRATAFAAGWPLVGLGVVISAWSAVVMRRAHESPDPRVPTKAIVSNGPFRFSRNPMYVAFTIGYVGLAFVLNTAWPLVFLPLVIAALHFGVIRREESYLDQKLGDAYRDYRRQVRRWL